VVVGHTRKNKPPPNWIVLPIVCVFAALSILSSIHVRPPAAVSPAITAGGSPAAGAHGHTGVAAPNPAALPAELPPAVPAVPAEAAPPPASAARVRRAEAIGSTPAIGDILLPQRTYRIQPRQNFAEVRVRRAAKSAGDVRFRWWTEAASARAGTDFVAQGPVTESFAEGMRGASLFVKVLPDDSRTQSRVFYIDVSDLNGAGTPPPVARIAVVLPTAH
jgi:hypothetical protein